MWRWVVGRVALLVVAAVVTAVGLGACVSGIPPTAAVREQSGWNVTERGDGGIVVTLKDRASRSAEIQRVSGRDADYARLNQRIQDVRDVYDPWNTIEDPISPFVELDDDTVTLRGNVQSEDEAVRMIGEALHTEGVFRVISYLSWPGHRPWDGIP